MAPTPPTLKNWAKEQYEDLDARATDGPVLTAICPVPLNPLHPGFIALIRQEKPKYGIYLALPRAEEHLQPLLTELADLYSQTRMWIVDDPTYPSIDSLLQRTSIPHILKADRFATVTQDERLAPVTHSGALYECYGGRFSLAAFLARPDARYERILLLSPLGTIQCQHDEISADLRSERKQPLIDICGVVDNYLPRQEVSDEHHKWEEGEEIDEPGVYPSDLPPPLTTLGRSTTPVQSRLLW